MVLTGHGHRADVQAAEEQREQFRAVGHAQQEPLLGPHAGRDQRGGRPPGEIVELAVGEVEWPCRPASMAVTATRSGRRGGVPAEQPLAALK